MNYEFQAAMNALYEAVGDDVFDVITDGADSLLEDDDSRGLDQAMTESALILYNNDVIDEAALIATSAVMDEYACNREITYDEALEVMSENLDPYTFNAVMSEAVSYAMYRLNEEGEAAAEEQTPAAEPAAEPVAQDDGKKKKKAPGKFRTTMGKAGNGIRTGAKATGRFLSPVHNYKAFGTGLRSAKEEGISEDEAKARKKAAWKEFGKGTAKVGGEGAAIAGTAILAKRAYDRKKAREAEEAKLMNRVKRKIHHESAGDPMSLADLRDICGSVYGY